ncbi:universal stress protein [Amycolatopsis sp. GM8]|uniref:universal stress protein n=1 Tax=Amycolatopsis sp. GM8 TaxID=2896530 RepID=UPI001F42898A|nr:universal stress protein [Amycolatopsis sp. GM8]
MSEALGGGPIVVGVDGSAAAMGAVRWAADEAARQRAPLRLVHAVATPAARVPGLARVVAYLHVEGRKLLAEAATAAPGIVVTKAIREQSPAEALLAESSTAAMLVLGATGQGAVPGVPTGSLPAKLAAYARCPVAVVRGHGDGPVVAGLDGGPLSEAVMAVAFEEAADRGVALMAVHAWSDSEFDESARGYLGWEEIAGAERRVLVESLAPWQEKYPEVPVKRVAVRDRPRQLLLEWSRHAQLVVVGHRGRGGFPDLALGSVGHALVQHAECPVLVVRPGS